MPAHSRRCVRHVPARRTGLALFGLYGIGRGLAIIGEPMVIDPGNAILHEAIPVPLRVTMWCVLGAVAVACAVLPMRWRMLGFIAAIIMPAERVASYLWSFAMWAIPGAPPGALDSAAFALAWAAQAGLILVVAGLPEAVVTHPKEAA